MTDTSKRLVGPAYLSNAAATVYTVPALTTAHLLHIRLLNEDSSSHNVKISIGADGGGSRIFNGTILAGELYTETCFEVVAAAEIVQAYADTANQVTLTISGVEVS